MTLEELEKEVPELLDYTADMPDSLRSLTFVKIYSTGEIIHHKDTELSYFGIAAKGDDRCLSPPPEGRTVAEHFLSAILHSRRLSGPYLRTAASRRNGLQPHRKEIHHHPAHP